MGWPKKLVLVRHAESEGNVRSVDERANFDIATHAYDITPRGRKQAAITGEYLRKEFGEFDVYYVSYYKRSKETMQVMYPNAKVYEDPRLAEGQRGIWHTMTQDLIESTFPGESARKKREGLYHYRPLGGENWADIELRIHSFLGTLSRDCEGKNVLIVVHGHWLLLMQRLIHHFSIDEAITKYQQHIFENTSVTYYRGGTKSDKSRLCLEYQNVIPWEGKL